MSAVLKELSDAKHSEGAATYWLLRLKQLRDGSGGGGGFGQQSLRPSRPQSGFTDGARAALAARGAGGAPQPPSQPSSARGRDKENAGYPAAAAGSKEQDTPTKKLTRSPKPLTLLSAYADGQGTGAEDPREARRSSPGLFGANKRAKKSSLISLSCLIT